MSYRKYDPEREYWNDGQDEDFTFYKPVKGKKKADIFRDREPEKKVYKSSYGTTGGDSYEYSSGNDYYRSKSYDRYGGSTSKRYKYNSKPSGRSQKRKVFRASENSEKKKTPLSSIKRQSSTQRYEGENTPKESGPKEVDKGGGGDDDLESILVEEESGDDDSESESEEEEFVLQTSPRTSNQGKYSSRYKRSQEVDSKNKNSNFSKRTVSSSRSNLSNSNYRRNDSKVSPKKKEPEFRLFENHNVKEIKPPSSPKDSRRGVIGRITKFTASPTQLGTSKKSPQPEPERRMAKIIKRDDFILPPRRFDKIYFQKNLTTPMTLIHAFRGVVKKHLKDISGLNKNSRNDMSNRHDSNDSQANMIQILRKTPILVASYPQQVKDIEENLKKNPNDAEALKKLVLCQATLKNYRQARKAISQVLAIVPKDPLIYDFLSIINEETGRIADALSNLEKLIEYDPKNAEKNRARYRRLLNQWFQDNDSEPKLPPNAVLGASELKQWTSYAKRVIQYWEEQLEDDELSDTEDEEEEEMGGEDDKIPVGGEKHACALMECIYYGYGCKKFKFSKKSCGRLMKWVKGYSSLAEGKHRMEKKCSSVLAYVAMCKSFVRIELKEYKEALDDSNMSFRNLQVVDELLVMSKRVLLKHFEGVVQKKSSMRNKLKEFAPLQLMWLTENLRMINTLKISMDTKERKEMKLGYLMKRINLYIDVMKQHSLSIQDLESAIQLFPENPDLYHKRSTVYEELKQLPKAMLDAKTADNLSGGKEFKHFERRLAMSSPDIHLAGTGNNNNNHQGGPNHQIDPMFDIMFNMRQRLRKMESGEDKVLVDYMNIDSVQKGSMDQAVHYLVNPKTRKYFGNIDYQDFINRIETEVKMMKFCQNENILSCCGFKKFSGDTVGICYDFVPEGTSLNSFIPDERSRTRKKPYDYLTALEKWEMIMQLASIVRQFHQKGIVLRNLCPRGCLVHPSDEVVSVPTGPSSLGPSQPKIKLKWFDLTYAVMRNAHSSSMEKLHPKFEATFEKVETHLQRYRAPETIFDHSCSHKSDIFSLGMMIYVIVTSYEPWPEIETKQVLYKIRSGEKPTYQKPNNRKKEHPTETMVIDSEFKILIEMCLNDDPKKRPTSQEVYYFAQRKKEAHILKQQFRISQISKEDEKRKEKRTQKKIEKELEKLRHDFIRKERRLEEKHKNEIKKKESEKSKLLLEMKKKERILLEEQQQNKKKKMIKEEEEEERNRQMMSNNNNNKLNEESERMMDQMKSVCRSLENLRNLLQCPISLELFTDPYMLVESGGVYEKSMITKWLKKNRTDPITNQVVLSKKRVPLKHLKNIIEEWKKTQAIIESTNLK